MKKLLLANFAFLSFLFLLSPSVKAQDPCGPPCTLSALMSENIVLCEEKNYSHPSDPLDVFDLVYVQVIINYRIKTCPDGTQSLVVENYVYIDNTSWWNSVPYGPSSIVPFNPDCKYRQGWSGSVSTLFAIQDAIQILLGKVGVSAQTYYDVAFPMACQSWTAVSFPAGSFYVTGANDSNQVDTIYLSDTDPVYMPIPCEDVCCKATYRWQEVVLSSGATVFQWVKFGQSLPPVENCEGSNPLNSENIHRLQAERYNPVSMQFEIVTGTIISQGPCEVICPIICPDPEEGVAPPAYSITTDIDKKETHIYINAYPIPAKNTIFIKAGEAVEKLVIYNSLGEAIKTNHNPTSLEFDISDIVPGTYFVQVFSKDNSVRTTKIIKQ